jgi:hypothetical protein
MFIAILTLLSALSISSVAAFYSIVGLATIFPGAFYPVILMGAVLEAGKLVCASWLYRNWNITNRALRTYLFTAVIILSLITSMGIFGFLSKAHLENDYQSNSNSQQIEVIDSQIKHERDIIARQQETIKRNSGEGGGSGEQIALLKNKLRQMDAEVKAYTDQGSSGIFNDNVAKGVSLKQQQKAERDKIEAEIRQLTSSNSGNNAAAESTISKSQQRIQELIARKAPLQQAQVKLDADIGPIKYIGALAVDLGLTDKVNTGAAVRWVIIIIIFVFDPLAVLMLVAANQSFARKFPTLMEQPRDIIDLEKPDLDLPPMAEPKSSIIDNIKKKYETQLKEWQEKLAKFNEKAKETEAAQQDTATDSVTYTIKDAIDNTPNNQDSEKKTSEEEITQYIDPVESEKKLKEFHQEHGLFEDAAEETAEEIAEQPKAEVKQKKSILGSIGSVFIKNKKPINVVNVIEKNNAVEQTALPTISNEELKKEFGIETEGYRQNEEQAESNGWSKIVKVKDTTLEHDEYRKRISDRINTLVEQVKSGEIQLTDLSEEDQKTVNNIINPNA